MQSVLLMHSRAAALAHPRGDIGLRLCPTCEFIFNEAFDPASQEFSERYEETQSFSPTFRTFHERLAADLVERWNLRGKRIVEIGCGKGDFLALLCSLGNNEGLGFDPAFAPDRNPAAATDRVRFVRVLYPPPPGTVQGWDTPDFVCCKMTLEHIGDVGRFVHDVRRGLRTAPGAVVFFQVPNAARILEDAAFWDVYYEHCSYFTEASLSRLLKTAGYRILDTWTDYDGQYLMIAASPGWPVSDPSGQSEDPLSGRAHSPGERSDAPPSLEPGTGITTFAAAFSSRVADQLDAWAERIDAARSTGRPTAVWGGGSKAVAFLSAIADRLAPRWVVDINPHKQGTFLPGSGHEVVAPGRLVEARPSLVIAMNPVYLDEIRAMLADLGLDPPVVGLGRTPGLTGAD